jgi:hypothetical protein
MATPKSSSSKTNRNDAVVQHIPHCVNSNVFPYPENKEFRGHRFFMKVVGILKNGCDAPIRQHEFHEEDSEYLLEYVSITTSGTDLIKNRKKDIVYEDHFNQAVVNMIGDRKFSYDRLVKVCSKYENETNLQEHISSSDKKWKYFQKRMDENTARAVAFAIAFYTGSQSYGINRSASVIARKSNGEALAIIKDGDLEDASIILYYLVRGLVHIPYYWGVTARAINLTEEELKSYVPGALVTWLQFSSSTKGYDAGTEFTKDRNTQFIIHSLTGRSIQEFSIFPIEDEILFLPHSTFLVIDHRLDKDKHFIYIRQIELGLCQLSVLWVDDHIFDEKWETKEHMQRASTRSLNDNVHFIPKSTTNHALSFLRSPFGQRLKNCSTFRIVTDMRRDNEEEPRYAGIRLIKGVRQLGFQNQCLIFTGYEDKAREKLEVELTKDERANLLVTENSEKLHEFVGFKN